jgi:hypothetical protein
MNKLFEIKTWKKKQKGTKNVFNTKIKTHCG